MAILTGDSGKTLDGTLKTFNFTYSNYEKLIGTPISVPNVGSLPATPIDSYTVQASDFPTITPNPQSVKYTAILHVCGKNTDTVNKSLNYQINKNGVSVLATSFSATANQFYTIALYKFMDIAVGDVIDIYLYCGTSALINYDYVSLIICPTQLVLSKAKIVKDVTLNTTSHTFSQGNPLLNFQGYWYFYPATNASTSNQAMNLNGNISGLTFNPQANIYSFGRAQYGDFSGYGNGVYTNQSNSATNRPWYYKNYVPSTISFREVLR